MTKSELKTQLEQTEYELEQTQYELEKAKVKTEIDRMLNGCTSLHTLTEMKKEIEKLYHRHTNDWQNEALRDNICNLAVQLSDNYNYEKLSNINAFMYALLIDDKEINTKNLFMTSYMKNMESKHSEKVGVA